MDPVILSSFAKDPRFVGCKTAGFTGILHTWTRQLEYHPHVHFIVPGGGLSTDANEWKSSGGDFFIHAKPLSKIYRAKFIDQLKKEGLEVPSVVWKPDWVVDVRNVGNGKKALTYLAQYIFRVAIAPSRILNVSDTHVRFKYQDSKTKIWGTCRLRIFEFMRRYLQHTLPHRFIKVRHYGFLSPNCRTSLERIRELICALYEILLELLPEPKPPHRKPWKCKTCGGIIRWRAFIPCPRGAGYIDRFTKQPGRPRYKHQVLPLPILGRGHRTGMLVYRENRKKRRSLQLRAPRKVQKEESLKIKRAPDAPR